MKEHILYIWKKVKPLSAKDKNTFAKIYAFIRQKIKATG